MTTKSKQSKSKGSKTKPREVNPADPLRSTTAELTPEQVHQLVTGNPPPSSQKEPKPSDQSLSKWERRANAIFAIRGRPDLSAGDPIANTVKNNPGLTYEEAEEMAEALGW